MQCPLCQTENPPTAASCTKCSTPLPLNDQTLDGAVPSGALPASTTPRGTSAWSVAVTAPPDAPYPQGEELVGTLLADRYEILELLGQGGMGAVYKARDTELGRLVALKLIRPDLASNPEILLRFKQELILAREVTHRNVIRIFDLGQAKGFKFITMEFVEGRDLRAVLRERGKLPPDEAVRIIAQVCRALESAHAAGVVHRDLKPQNIMLDAKDRVYVMDFGIAHSLETPGMTQTGALMGTPEYMSPEQAKGIKVDARSDLFALGIIFYEMLTGFSPYKADSALATLLKRTQERPPPPAEVDPTIPKAISDVVMKCLEIDRDHRYSTTREILEDLGHEMPTSVRTVAPTLPPAIPTPQVEGILPFVRYRTWIAGGAAVVLLAALGFAFRGKIFPAKRATPVEQASLAILPFRNASGDTSLDWLGPSLADMLSTDVGQSARLRTISPDRLHQVLADLRIARDSAIDPTTLRRLAEFSSADIVVWGQYARFGDQIRIDATLHDLKHDRSVPLKIAGVAEKDIPSAVDRLAESIRQNLAVSPDVVKELKASSFQPSSKSLPALRDYNQGIQLLREGKNLEALKNFKAATERDPQFALAFSKLAETYANLGYDSEADQSARRAVELSESLTPAEKYAINASQARISKNYPKAIEAYENLAKISPDNTDVRSALGDLYENTGDFSKANEQYQKVLAANPKDITSLLAIGRVDIKSGDSQASLDPLNRALSLAIQMDNEEQKALILQALGIAYSDLNKPEEALHNYQQSFEIKRRLGQRKGIADSLNMIASVYEGLGKPDLALTNAKEALKIYRKIGDRQDVGTVLINLGWFQHNRGKYDDALKLFKESLQIQRDLGNENDQALCLNNIGNSYAFKGDYDDARTYFEQALQLREKIKVPSDIAETLHNLGEVSMKMGQYDQALTLYLRALDLRRGASDKLGVAKESDSLGILFAYQGRFGAALKAREEAMKGLRESQDRSYWMAETLGGYGDALAQVGRFDEAGIHLDQALSLARELKNDPLAAEIIVWQGDNFRYKGDSKSAKSLYMQAEQIASKSSDRDLHIALQVKVADLSVAEGGSRSSIAGLQALAEQAAGAGLKYMSIEASLSAAEALIKARGYAQARQVLQNLLASSEKLGAQPLLAKSHLLLGTVLRMSGNAGDASREYRKAIEALNEMRKDAGDKFVGRADVKAMMEEATHWAGTSKS
jgi:serine/threonine protein kinase/tetratricopeptide (TPR) repeat protein